VYPGSVADAEVVQHRRALLERLASSAEPVALSRTDERGRFSFPALDPGNYAVEARGADGRVAMTPGVSLESGHYAGVSLLLDRGTPVQDGLVTGRVQGAPAGAAVRVEAPIQGSSASVGVAADGTFTVRGLPVGVPVALKAFTSVGAQRWVGRAKASPGEEVSIELRPAPTKNAPAVGRGAR